MSIEILTTLLKQIGPSGREGPAAKYWRNEAEQFATVTKDRAGNSYAKLQVSGPSSMHHIALTGHIDEIGFVVQSIDSDGLLWIGEVGGWDPQVFAAQRVVLIHEGQEVYGVVGRKAVHLIEEEDFDKASKFKDLWVDIGATSKKAAKKRAAVGDMGVVAVAPLLLSEKRLASRAMDNRVGSYVVLEALRRLAETPMGCSVSAIVTSMEEVGLRGAVVAAEQCNADIVVAVDVTFATDVGDVDKKQLGKHKLGSGPVITRGAFHSPVIENLLLKVAKELEIEHTVQAAGGGTGTDADSFAIGKKGLATGLVSVPLRYMHTPGEIIDLDDIEGTVQLLVGFCRAVDDNLDLTDR